MLKITSGRKSVPCMNKFPEKLLSIIANGNNLYLGDVKNFIESEEIGLNTDDAIFFLFLSLISTNLNLTISLLSLNIKKLPLKRNKNNKNHVYC